MSSQQSSAAPGAIAEIKPASPRNRKSLLQFIAIILVAVVVYFGYNAYKFNSTHATTDDAQLTSDIVSIAPQVSASVISVPVKDNQEVKSGDVLCELDKASLTAAYNQAKANLDSAISAAKQADDAILLATDVGSAQQLTANGVVSQAESAITQAKSELVRSSGAVQSALAVKDSALANLNLAISAHKAAEANLQHARDAADASQAQVTNSQAALAASQSAVEAALAVYERTDHDATRYAKLYQEGAMSAQTAENAASVSHQSRAQVESARHAATQARAAVTQAQANVRAAKQQIEASIAAVAEAQARIDTAKAQSNGATASISETRAQVAEAAQGIKQAEAKQKQAIGALHQANTAPEQVAETKSAKVQTLARIDQAKAALETAKIQLDYARIVAPVSGKISKKTVELGQFVQAGTPLMTIIPDDDVWVVANYKETQLAGVKQGSRAIVEVDGIPDRTFKAHVDSISAGTGATFALLPPDNATGNFTKVVQRIAVKIVIDSGQPDMDRLRAGMSVTSTIATK